MNEPKRLRASGAGLMVKKFLKRLDEGKMIDRSKPYGTGGQRKCVPAAKALLKLASPTRLRVGE